MVAVGPTVAQGRFAVPAGDYAVVQAVVRWLPLAPRGFKLFSGGCRWPRGGSSCFPVAAAGPAVVQAVVRWLPLAPRQFKLLSGACRWPHGGASSYRN